ncbi:MAG: hypothetical protein ACTHMC_06640 [Pseudobacter sp.]|uniref:hypothetical protein n=1 Tax=Pseudobacter sp. TaxID=2045420 RepID=UPI003F7D7631
MRIGIFETDHFEVSHTLIRLFQLPEHQLTIFSYPVSWRQFRQMPDLDLKAHQWVIKGESQSKASFIYQIYRTVRKQKIELLFLETVTDNFIFYAWLIKALPGIRIILTIHDINSYFHYQEDGSLRRRIRNMGKRKLVEAVKEFSVINSTMVDYLKSLLPAGKQVRYLPGSFFDREEFVPPPASMDPIRLVVPGSVDGRRRDYEAVFELVEACHEQQLNVEVTLLGGFHQEPGMRLMKRVLDFSDKYPNLRWCEDPVVPQPVFDEVMREAHFILAPSVISTVISDGVREEYGVSMSSGNIADMVRYARPAIVPAALVTGPEISHIAFRYQSIKEIPEQLKLLRDHPEKYFALQQQALAGSEAFSPDAIRSQHSDLFTGVNS